MSNTFERFRKGDPSIPLALAAIVRISADGRFNFDDLAVAYREDYISVNRKAYGESAQVGSLSMDQVRRHLRQSVLPRLVTEGVLCELPAEVTGQTGLEVTESAWNEIQITDACRDSLVQMVLETLHETETQGLPTGSTGAVLTGEGLTKIYRKRKVVDSVDLRITQNEIIGLLGPNGAGKTTTFYMIVGLIRPDAGCIKLDQRDISTLPMYKRARLGIGYLAQEPSIFRKLTVEQNVMAILETMNIPEVEQRERLETLLDELSIKHLRNVPAYSLSGGERRRLEITRALVTQPRFMLLDEPFAGVDPIAVHDIQTIVAGLRKRGIGVVITDHNVEQTLDIVDRAYIMFEGKVQVSGTVRELVFDERVADLYLGPTLTARLRERLGEAA